MQQLDIFDDSRDVMLVNDLAAALLSGEAGRARDAIDALEHEFPGHPRLPQAEVMWAELSGRSLVPWTDHAQAAAAWQRWRADVEPAAVAILGAGAFVQWRRLRLAELARRAQALPWLPAQPGTHPAALWLAAGQWQTALQAIGAVSSWRRQPQLLAWAAQCQWHQGGPDAAWPLLAELAWMAPARLPTLVADLGDYRLNRWLARMGEELDEDNGAWFPAWLLVDQPLLAEPLGLAERHTHTPPEQAFATVLALLRLERQGRHPDVVAQRRLLKGQHPGLFACYMKTR